VVSAWSLEPPLSMAFVCTASRLFLNVRCLKDNILSCLYEHLNLPITKHLPSKTMEAGAWTGGDIPIHRETLVRCSAQSLAEADRGLCLPVHQIPPNAFWQAMGESKSCFANIYRVWIEKLVWLHYHDSTESIPALSRCTSSLSPQRFAPALFLIYAFSFLQTRLPCTHDTMTSASTVVLPMFPNVSHPTSFRLHLAGRRTIRRHT
jgi:hypothetical protein